MSLGTPKVLVIEDDEDINNLIAYHLQNHRFKVLQVFNGKEGYKFAFEERPNIIILDLMLPDVDGFEICKQLKKHKETAAIPIIILTARSEEIDRILGFELGADDYVVKPFSPRELILRVKSVLRRYEPPKEGIKIWEKDGLKFNIESHTISVNGNTEYLTATEFKLLLNFIENEGRTLTRDFLLDKVWGYQFEGYARTVDTHIRRLRKKLGSYSHWINTVRGFGYKFETREKE